MFDRARDTLLSGAARATDSGSRALADAGRVLRFLGGRAAFRARPDDVFVVTYPRSGTTWMTCILALLRGGGGIDWDHISSVVPWFERSLAVGSNDARSFEAMPSPRIFKSHLTWRWMPRGVRSIYVRRDGRDVALSYYRLYRSHLGYRGSFDAFFRRFMRGDLQYGAWFEHVARWQARAQREDVLLLEYEQLHAEPEAVIARVARFAGFEVSEARVAEIAQLASIESMRRHQERFDHATEVLRERGISRGRFFGPGKAGLGSAALSEDQEQAFAEALARGPRIVRSLRELDLPAFLQ